MREDQSGIWTQFLSVLDSIPEDGIAITVYVLGTLIILWCWYAIAKRLPSPIGGITWIVIFAILATPTISEGPNSAVAPAFFGLVFGVLTKNSPIIWSNFSLIAFVIGIGLCAGYFWSNYQTNKNARNASINIKTTSPL
ncbi:hypothetical protein AMD27_07445 [Acinetobacter sp. TGL-Y2]|uniref:hypothetical protein n=1 Tax=Acinetobacter sp. TGL-Y2 TaxID=1407071 RepID=UPI0007A67E1B|nr:hypothetical protein [Acinetobacter sp. TGL-Y2]AMW78731.1 hypothetical protein AMD27_07445 [Acinetobacter sp. TGL-Y2]